MSKLSVIVPIYNAEKYLAECLESLVGQSLEDIEIILVDDGSIDDSLAIANDKAQKDSRIKVFSQANQGAAAARNFGIDNATGEYITFVDADDAIHLKAYDYLYRLAQKGDYDVLKYNIETIYDDSEIDRAIKKHFDENISVLENEDVILKNHVSACTKIVKTTILQENNLYFPAGLAYEDVYFHWAVMLRSKKSALVDYPFYFYRRSMNESTSLIKSSKTFDIFEIYYMSLELIEEKRPEYTEFFVNMIIKVLPFYYYKVPFWQKRKFLQKLNRLLRKYACGLKNESSFTDRQIDCILSGSYCLFFFYEFCDFVKKMSRIYRIFIEQKL